KPRADYQILQFARDRQDTETFKQHYKKRAGIEGTLSQGTRAFGMRRSRYLGLAKTHLQHLATAAAMNLPRAVQWLETSSKPRTTSLPLPWLSWPHPENAQQSLLIVVEHLWAIC
ncbi:MAG: transposase, partial [Anaerolineae bacterium]|nr:transposase [Anaerolineae bacterium]